MQSKVQKQLIERIENLSLKIIDPASTEYKDRSSHHNVAPIIDLILLLYCHQHDPGGCLS